ncbi:putative CXXCH cytochrome family protein [Geothermobacter ehrlichii]|uniref:Putative CXXCH cytochrome family protein n=1 Tax=Geothermobacter ehrlichii TaxID=213224 RepID=A0A5D3WGB3_9BACT|nr:cytochrome c3 family protein [Geothermobacter ehrlichii]TYO95043.1 putative CXXCH cytochrome family protein [Geothermobacter ehrlichii]
MKKVLVLLAAAALLASPAFGAVRNSKHDLSSSSTATIKSTNIDEVCVFCHTPHSGATGLLAPLWNRSIPGGSIAAADLYNSATLDQTNSNPSTVVGAVNNSDAPLCMSCHDGASLTDPLLNPPASAGNVQPAGLSNVTGNANVFGDTLRNDHPIGMDYGAVQAADTAGFNAETTANVDVGGLPLYTANGVMWCSTCHDVHGQGGGDPFLNMSNAGSALCTTCHIK